VFAIVAILVSIQEAPRCKKQCFYFWYMDCSSVFDEFFLMNFMVIFLSEKGIDILYTISVFDIKRVKKGNISKFEKVSKMGQNFNILYFLR